MRSVRPFRQSPHSHATSPTRRSRTHRFLRFCLATLLTLAAFAALFLLLHYLLIPFLAWCSPDIDIWLYDHGAYGVNPERQYHTFNVKTEDARSPKWDTDVCEQERREGGLILIDVHGAGVSADGARIVDLKGNLVWMDASYGEHVMNLQLQEWKGQRYLTFWAGDGDLGDYYMLDSGFNHVKTVRPVGQGLRGDPHEFNITPEGTALIAIYNCTQDFDLGDTHISDITPNIFDAVIQEIDLESGGLLFEWRASEHFNDGEYLKYSYETAPTYLSERPQCLYGEEKSAPHDYFHMNSIEKDSDGNYLVSIRLTHQIICISGSTGQILWGIGGNATDFTDQGDGHSGDFKWQHHARWVDENQGILSLFDNGIAQDHFGDNDHSLGRILQLDVANRTAKQLHSYSSLHHIRSTSQGSFQFLPGTEGAQDRPNAGTVAGPRDQVFTGWGSATAFSLHDAESEELLCETHYSPSLFFYWERAKTYRAIRAPKDMKFRPEKWDPQAVMKQGRVYVSWNGGMEVQSWVLRGRDQLNQWKDILTVERDGFETSFKVPAGKECSTYTVAALDGEGNELRLSNEFEHSGRLATWLMVLLGSAAILLISIIYAAVRMRIKRSQTRQTSAFPTFFSDGANRFEGYRKLEAAEEELDELYPSAPG